MAQSATTRHRGTLVVLAATLVMAMGRPNSFRAGDSQSYRSSREPSEIEMKNTYLELPSHSPASRTIALTTVAMVAFTANSVLCRLAFTSASIDPATFTLVRLSSGTVRHCAPERKPTFAGLKLLERIWFWVGPWAEERTNFEARGEYIRRPLIGDGAMSLIGTKRT